jgi:hypothetical protein
MVANEGKITTFGTTGTLGGLVDGTDTIHTGVAKTLFAIASGCRVVSSGTFTQSSDDFVLANPTTYRTLGTKVTLSSSSGHNTVTVGAGDSTYDRYDLIYIDAGNNRLAISAGQVNPARIADINNDDVPVAIVKVAAGAAATNTHSFQTLMSVYNTDSFAGDDIVSLIIGADADGTDRTITFGHSTLKTIMGIDDSADKFIINTDATFDATAANNSLTIDASHNVTIAGDLTVTGGIIDNSGSIGFNNGQNATLDVAATAHNVAGKNLTISAGTTTVGTTNDIAGGSVTIKGGAGKGTGAGGDIVFQTANAAGGSAHTPLNSHATALTLSDDLSATFGGNVSFAGTTLTSTGADLNIISAGNMVLRIDSNNDETGQSFAFQNNASTEIANLSEAGNLQIDGTLNVDGSGASDIAGPLSAAGLHTSNAFTTGRQLINASDSSSSNRIVSAEHTMIFFHTADSNNNVCTLPTAVNGTIQFLFNVDSAHDITITSSQHINDSNTGHTLIPSANTISLKPYQSIILRGAADDSPMNAGYYTLDFDSDTGTTSAIEQGLHTIWVPAASMYPNTTSGCAALAQVELANGPELKCLDFDTSSDEFAQFTVAFPKSWNEGTITFQPFWTVTGTNTGTVAWELSGVGFGNSDDINTAFGTAISTTALAHSGTSNDMMVSATSGAVTISGASVDSVTYFQINRDTGGDTQTGDARLVGIKIYYTINAGNDA